MKRSYLKRLVCLTVAALVLCSALAVAAMNGSPYEVLKRALLDVSKLSNYTMRTEQGFLVDGAETESDVRVSLYGNDRLLTYGEDPALFDFYSEDYNVSAWYGYDDEFTWYGAQSPGYLQTPRVTGVSRLTESRFMELLLDLLVGDLKNNISMTQDGGIRHITGTLTASQIPELYNAGLEVLLAESGSSFNYLTDNAVVSMDLVNNRCVTETVILNGADKIVERYEHVIGQVRSYDDSYWDLEYGGRHYVYEDTRRLSSETVPATREDYAQLEYDPGPITGVLPTSRARLTYIHGDARVDAEGRLLHLSGTVSMELTDLFGEVQELDFVLGMDITDIGETAPECPIAEVEELLEEYEHDYATYTHIRFRLNEDGTVARGSVFDEMQYGRDAIMPAGADESDEAAEPESDSDLL